MTSEALERSRARILGDERVVVIEAAAGCGKTFEAVGGTTALAQQLEDGQEVLLLTHTNSARRVFEGRLSVAGTRATMQTLDSLAFEVVKRYAPHLGLEQPVVPDAVHRGHPSFKDIRGMARRLLESAPAVAEGLAWRHPVILVDEHQDSSDDQHAVVAAIAEKRDTRVRYFGDRLQSIYGFDGGGGAWDSLCEQHEKATLEFGQRWNENAELRDWLFSARRALLAGEPIDLRDRPRCVHVHEWSGEPPGINRKGHCPEVWRCCNDCSCTVAARSSSPRTPMRAASSSDSATARPSSTKVPTSRSRVDASSWCSTPTVTHRGWPGCSVRSSARWAPASRRAASRSWPPCARRRASTSAGARTSSRSSTSATASTTARPSAPGSRHSARRSSCAANSSGGRCDGTRYGCSRQCRATPTTISPRCWRRREPADSAVVRLRTR